MGRRIKIVGFTVRRLISTAVGQHEGEEGAIHVHFACPLF